jgi:hypothetical protein
MRRSSSSLASVFAQLLPPTPHRRLERRVRAHGVPPERELVAVAAVREALLDPVLRLVAAALEDVAERAVEVPERARDDRCASSKSISTSSPLAVMRPTASPSRLGRSRGRDSSRRISITTSTGTSL